MFKRTSFPIVTSKPAAAFVTHLTTHLGWLLAWIVIAAALSLVAAQMTRAEAGDVQLRAGRLKATLELAGDGTTQASGSTIFVDIELRTSRRRDEAGFHFIVSGGEIVKITGKRIEVSGTGASRAITALRLRRNRPRYIKAEIFLGDRDRRDEKSRAETAADTAGDQAQPAARTAARVTSTTFSMTLHDRESNDSDVHVASWQLSNCARDYHDGLSAIRAGTAKRMIAAQAGLRTKDDRLPGSWLFSNRRLKRARSRLGNGRPSTCRSYVRRAGRRRCAKWSRVGSAMALPPEPTRAERKVMGFLAEFMQRRGFAPEFGDNGRYRWLTYRVSNDLNNYLKQPPYAALCTGAEQLLAFHKRNMRPFKSRSDKVRALVQKARDLAKARVKAVFTLVAEKEHLRAELRAKKAHAERLASEQALARPSPSLVSPAAAAQSQGDKPPAVRTPLPMPAMPAPLVAPIEVKPVPQSYLDMIREFAALVLPPDRLFGIKVETKPFAALKSMMSELSARRTASEQATAPIRAAAKPSPDAFLETLPRALPDRGPATWPETWNDKDIMAAAIAALRMIEAGVYADMLQARYSGITNGINDTILAIGTARKQSCTCR